MIMISKMQENFRQRACPYIPINKFRGFRPHLVMENVPGMIKGPMKGRFIEIMRELKKTNYVVKCKKMNSKYYGVPQSRERLIFIGVRKDINKEPVFPKPSNKVISAFEALKDVPVNKIREIKSSHIKKYIHLMKPGEDSCKYSGTRSYFNIKRIYKHKPSYTITKKCSLIHYDEDRYLSSNECKVLSSFPLDWDLGNNEKKALERIGNAVMPRFMQAIAETIKEKILT